MGKHSILVWNNGKSQRTILHATGYNLPETSINNGQESLTKFYSMFAKNFKESDRVHAYLAVATTQQREEWTHQPRGVVVTETEDSDSENKDSVIHLLIYPEDSDGEKYLRDPPSV